MEREEISLCLHFPPLSPFNLSISHFLSLSFSSFSLHFLAARLPSCPRLRQPDIRKTLNTISEYRYPHTLHSNNKLPLSIMYSPSLTFYALIQSLSLTHIINALYLTLCLYCLCISFVNGGIT